MHLKELQKIIIYDCDPGGNYTYIAYGKRLLRQSYGCIDELIRKQYPHFEQGGFLEKAAGNSVIRLQMAGGEFCGNATRCLGALVIEDYLHGKDLAAIANYDLLQHFMLNGAGVGFSVEVSGADTPLQIECNPTAIGNWTVKTEIPIEKNFSNISANTLTLQNKLVNVLVVRMQGIVHILIDTAHLSFPVDAEQQSALLKQALYQLDLAMYPAVGLIWYSTSAAAFRIDPIVWVQQINTCIYESACGSGSVALALAKLKDADAEEITYEIEQPSLRPISVNVTKNTQGQQFLTANISGQVAIKRLPDMEVDASAAALTSELQVSSAEANT